MGINIFWDEQHSDIVHLVIDGGWTWDEFYRAMRIMHGQMDKSSHEKIQFIVDMRNGQTLPQNVLSRMREISNQHHPKSDKMVVIGAGDFPKLLFGIMEKLLPERMNHVSLVETIEEAYEIVLERRTQAVDG